jgi:hypothetical protein
LIQYLIHEWGRLRPLGSPVVSCLTQLDCVAERLVNTARGSARYT